ncbi:AAA family ATPase [Alteromonas ponticola]|uniref:AAA family ATPase n=1 Tax=Alteromonas aquimaris TaxID=2998417 RepID=A0ABT3P9H1_9ALTE|nr:AAA family ATPase [Alteromonas aquimaris]MCW8109355.1 AAA family ATPase [Alteromonas aquimaris]
MKAEQVSCVIDYPGHVPAAVKKQPLSTRVRLLVIAHEAPLTTIAETTLASDKMLEVTVKQTLPDDLTPFQAAIIGINDEPERHAATLAKIAKALAHIILVPDILTADIARLAVQFKVSDLILSSDIHNGLYPALAIIADNLKQHAKMAESITVVNGKAGSGATFITCGLAELFTQQVDADIALIDADFNFSSLAYGLGLNNRYSINQAVKELDKLDEAAVRTMMSGKNKLHLIGNSPFARLHEDSVTPTQLNSLSWKIRQTYDQVLVDMSKGLESQTLPLLLQSSCILIVMQMSVACLRETKAMLKEMRTLIDFHQCKVAIVVNRYHKDKEEIKLSDIKTVLEVDTLFTISNNFALANQRTELGKPLASVANHKVMASELAHILRFASSLAKPPASSAKAGFLHRLLRRG